MSVLVLLSFLVGFLSNPGGPGAVQPGAEQAVVQEERPAGSEATAPATTTGAGDWILECVDCPPWFEDMTEHHLRLDAQGYPHIAYGGKHLYYAWQTAEGWHRQVVDEVPFAGQYASLALDAAGYAHIAYGGPGKEIRYAAQDAAGWHTETVTNSLSASLGPDIDLVLGPGGQPHLGFCSRGPDYVLRHAYHDWAGWHFETVDTDLGEYGWDVSMDVDSGGYVHVVYYDSVDERFRYAYQTRGGWQVDTTNLAGSPSSPAAPNTVVCGTPNLVLDTQNRVHVAYSVWDRVNQWSYLMYKYKDVAGWHAEIADWSNDCAYVSLAVDASGEPHISLQESLAADLQYAYRDAEGWQVETVDSEGSTGYYNSIAVDSLGRPHISYYDLDRGDLRYAYLDNGTWQLKTLDDGGRIASGNALVLDDRDVPHISYYEDTSGEKTLRYGHLAATGWISEVVESGTYYGWRPSLALDQAGDPHLSYYQLHLGGGLILMYGYRDAVGWHVQQIEDEWYTGKGSSLALDDAGYPHVSHAGGYTTPSLRYIFQDVDGWHATIVDFEGNAPTSLALDGDGRPHISYKADGGLRYAYDDGLEWHIQAVDSGQQNGLGNSLALDSSANPHITYCDQAAPAVKYAHLTPGGWQIQTIEGISADQTSLILDAAGNPHVSYAVVNEVRYAYRDASGWHIATVDAEGGGSPSLALDRSGRPHILYGGTGPYYELKYARLPGPPQMIYLPLVQRH
jgi:hypothetical protein